MGVSFGCSWQEIMNSFVGFMVLVELAVCICNTLKVSTHLSFLDFRTKGRYQEWSLLTLQKVHSNFMSKAGGNLKQAKHFNNVIGDYFFDIPLENVSIY